jgi:MFS transporter, CP family, cyanate transporter
VRRDAGGGALAVAIVLASANLRPAVVSVGPVLEDIRVDLGLSGAAASVLTALPLLCFGAGALIAPRLGRRFGSDAVLLVVLGATTLGQVLRVVPGVVTLFGGTFLAGAAIALANVLIPAMVKREFPTRAGLMMGSYISVMVAGAAGAALLTVPLTAALGGGSWRAGLAAWAAPAGLAFAVWLVVAARRRRGRVADGRSVEVPASLARDRVAWQVTVFLGLQSFGFYAVLAWLPSLYRSYGVSPAAAGQLLAVVVILGVPTALVVPSLMTRSARQSGWAVGAVAVGGLGLLGLLLAPLAAPYLWVSLLGLGYGVSFPLGLTLAVLRSRTPAEAAQLSAMSQSVGYCLAAAGPLAFGLLHDVSGGWALPVAFILVALVPQAAAGLAAGKPVFVQGTGAALRRS